MECIQMSTSDESLKETGRCAAASIVEMVAALECDYDRLEELREEKADSSAEAIEDGAWAANNPSEAEALAELEKAAGECSSREDAEQRIQEDALSVMVRSGWYEPTANHLEHQSPEEFQILLSTGGPAVQIRGELDEHGEPCRAWLEVQDWGTPWIRYFDISQDTLLTYARCFYFGEG
jgi:hypothetical protein